MKILANDGISNSGKVALETAGFTVITEKVDQSNLISSVNENNYEVVLVRSATTVRKEVIDACPNLKMIGRGGVGMDNIDVEYARNKGIFVFNTPSASSQSVAELVMAHLFGLVRSLYDSNRRMPKDGVADFKTLKKAYAKGSELRGKTIGILGFGRIGQSLASYALGIGMNVLATDMFVEKATIPLNIAGNKLDIDIHTVSMDKLLANSDFISLHIPKQANGAAAIGKDELAKMKDGVALINLARGGVIDEKVIIEGLNEGKISHVALDVYENEPVPSSDILNHSKISLTPHIGAATVEAQDRIGEEIASIIINKYKELVS